MFVGSMKTCLELTILYDDFMMTSTKVGSAQVLSALTLDLMTSDSGLTIVCTHALQTLSYCANQEKYIRIPVLLQTHLRIDLISELEIVQSSRYMYVS